MQTDKLRTSVISGMRWSAGTRLLVQGLTWLVTIRVVQIVTPEQYGLAAIAGVVTGYLNLLNEFGLSFALIQRRVEDKLILRCVFGLLLVSGTFLSLFLLASAAFIARFFHSPEAAPLIRITSLQFLAMAFCVIPQSTLSRQLRFKDLSSANFIANVMGSVSTLILASLGFGAKALVAGPIVIVLTRALSLNWIAPFLLAPAFQFRRLRGLLRASSLIIVDRSLWYCSTAIDSLVVGRSLGASALGSYSLAHTIAGIPMERALEVVNTVALPAYASVQEDLSRVAKAYLKSLRLWAALSVPIFWGMSLVAAPLVTLLFGPKWGPAIPVIQIVCVAMPIRSLNPLAPPVLMAIGRTSVAVKITLWMAVVVPACILLGARSGLIGIAVAWCVAYPIVFVIGTYYLISTLGVEVGEIGTALAAPVIAGLAMAAAVLVFPQFVGRGSSLVSLAVDVAGGAVVYVATLRVIFPARFDELRDFVRSFVSIPVQPA